MRNSCAALTVWRAAHVSHRSCTPLSTRERVSRLVSGFSEGAVAHLPGCLALHELKVVHKDSCAAEESARDAPAAQTGGQTKPPLKLQKRPDRAALGRRARTRTLDDLELAILHLSQVGVRVRDHGCVGAVLSASWELKDRDTIASVSRQPQHKLVPVLRHPRMRISRGT